MRLPATILFCVAFCGAATVQAASVLGAKGQFSTFLSELKYDPSRGCAKPWPPSSPDSSSAQRYAADAQTYLDCLKRVSSADVTYAQEVIVEGYEREAQSFLADFQRYR